MNREVVEQFIQRVWNDKDINAVDDLFSKEVRIHSPLGEFRSIDKMKKIIEKWLHEIPDMEVTHLHCLEGDGALASHWDCKGITRDNKPIHYQGVTVFKMENGKIVDYWAYLDGWTVEKQLGRKL